MNRCCFKTLDTVQDWQNEALVTNNVFYIAWNFKLYESIEHVDKVHGGLNSTISTQLLAASAEWFLQSFGQNLKVMKEIFGDLLLDLPF